MPTFEITRLTPKMRARLGAALDEVQGNASARLLAPADIIDCYQRARANGWATEHGGYAPNSYSYLAECTAVAAVRVGNVVHLRIGRGRAQSRAGGRGGTVDVSVRTQLWAPEWTANAEERRRRYARWLGADPSRALARAKPCSPGCPGWVLDVSGDVQRCDDCAVFASDDDAAWHVRECEAP